MTISIVIPSYQQGWALEQAIRSVLDQTLPDGVRTELFVMDGGSTDDTRAVLEKYADRMADWRSAPDDGQTAAINEGLGRASGEILAYLCADDFYEPGALARIAETFRTYPEIDVVYGDHYFLEGNSGWKRLKVSGPFTTQRLRRTNFLGQPAVFWRRQVWERFGPMDASLRYCMDYEYWLRISEGTHWQYISEPLATARLHADAKTSSQLASAWEETAVMADRYDIGPRVRRTAWWMRHGGTIYYLAKRRFFAFLGKRRAENLKPEA